MNHVEDSRQENQEREFLFTDDDFRFLSALANQKTGIQLPEQKRDMIYGRLARRLRALKLDNFSQYCNFLQSERADEEMDYLINAITTNLTSFFREGHHFQFLQEELSRMRDSSSSKKLRIWSAGCSSGMEPYSIAMTTLAAIPDIARWDAKILATDIDTNMVSTAENGVYSTKEVDGVSPMYRQYFDSLDPLNVEMSYSLKKLISFRRLNLLEDWPMKGPFDVIFCRNVFIYFDKQTKESIVSRYAALLKPKGLLFIGHSENLHGISEAFELVGRTIYRKRA